MKNPNAPAAKREAEEDSAQPPIESQRHGLFFTNVDPIDAVQGDLQLSGHSHIVAR